jgi:hypothetical protein
MAPLIFNLALHGVEWLVLQAGHIIPAPSEQEAGWASDPSDPCQGWSGRFETRSSHKWNHDSSDVQQDVQSLCRLGYTNGHVILYPPVKQGLWVHCNVFWSKIMENGFVVPDVACCGSKNQWYSTWGTRTPGGNRRHLRRYVKLKKNIINVLFHDKHWIIRARFRVSHKRSGRKVMRFGSAAIFFSLSLSFMRFLSGRLVLFYST